MVRDSASRSVNGAVPQPSDRLLLTTLSVTDSIPPEAFAIPPPLDVAVLSSRMLSVTA